MHLTSLGYCSLQSVGELFFKAKLCKFTNRGQLGSIIYPHGAFSFC